MVVDVTAHFVELSLDCGLFGFNKFDSKVSHHIQL